MKDHVENLYNSLRSIEHKEKLSVTKDNLEESADGFSHRELFTYRKTHPLILDLVLLKKFGSEWLDWEPETIWSEIGEEFGSKSISIHAKSKINAMKLLHLMDTPWTEWEVFNAVVQSLNDNVPDFKTLQQPTVDQIMAAVGMMKQTRKASFSEEVARYIAACFLNDGVFYAPPPVEFIQWLLMEKEYQCNKCGNIDTVEDQLTCDVCGASITDSMTRIKREFRSVKTRYDKVLADGADRDYELEESLVDVQVAKLLRANGWVIELQRRLSEQGGKGWMMQLLSGKEHS